jgi:hypothetical protein
VHIRLIAIRPGPRCTNRRWVSRLGADRDTRSLLLAGARSDGSCRGRPATLAGQRFLSPSQIRSGRRGDLSTGPTKFFFSAGVKRLRQDNHSRCSEPKTWSPGMRDDKPQASARRSPGLPASPPPTSPDSSAVLMAVTRGALLSEPLSRITPEGEAAALRVSC